MECFTLQESDRQLLQKPSAIPLYSCDPASICSTFTFGAKTLVGPLDEESVGISLCVFSLLAQQGFWMAALSKAYDRRLGVYYLEHATLDYMDATFHSFCEEEERLLKAVQALPYRPLLPLSRLISVVRIGRRAGDHILTIRPCPWVLKMANP